MISVYMDTAGNKRKQAITVGAVVGNVKRWIAFESAWPTFLGRYDVTRLHMTDFASSQREFRKWKGPEHSATRRKFIERAVSCAGRHSRGGFISTMAMADYDSVNAKYEVEERMGPPLTVCGMGIIGQIGRWAHKQGLDEKKDVLYFMEDGDEDKGKFISRARSYGFEVVPLSKAKSYIFDVCDMIAWKYNVGMMDADNKKGTFEDNTRSLLTVASLVLTDKAVDKNLLLEHVQNKRWRRAVAANTAVPSKR
jgi:hypothetical protein